MGLTVSDREHPRVEKCIRELQEIFEADVLEDVMGQMLREYVDEHLARFPNLYSQVFQTLQERQIISKPNFRLLLKS